MKKNLILLTLILLLLGFGLWQWSKKTNDTFNSNEHTQFAIKEVDDIGRIFIADRNNKQVDLRKDGAIWYYFSKEKNRNFIANQSSINIMLQTLTNIRTRAAAPVTAVENIVKDIAAKGKKVEVYSTKGKLLKTYYVGNPADGGEGTYMMMEGANMPYIVYYPKWVGSLDTRYNVEEMTWRDRAVFRVNPEDLEFVEVKYYDKMQHDASFRVERKSATDFEVKPVYESTAIAKTPFNKGNAALYLDDFEALVGESIVSTQSLLDSIPDMPIFATVTYKTKLHEKEQSFNVRPIFNPTADRGDGYEGTRQHIQRYIMDFPNGDAYVSQHIVAKKIFWSYKFFFQQEQVVMKAEESVLMQQGSLPVGKDTSLQGKAFTPAINN